MNLHASLPYPLDFFFLAAFFLDGPLLLAVAPFFFGFPNADSQLEE